MNLEVPGHLQMIVMTGFWPNFWPNFAATVVGAIFGIPIALGLARRQLKGQSEERDASRRERRLTIARLLRDALSKNLAELQRIAKVLDENQVVTDLHLSMEVWQVLRVDVMDVIESPITRASLASHFESIGQVQQDAHEQARRTLEAMWSPTNPDAGRADLIRGIEGSIASELSARALAEVATAQRLIDDLDLVVRVNRSGARGRS